MIPSLGRTVHFVLPDGQHRAAVISQVWDRGSPPDEGTACALTVFLDPIHDEDLFTRHGNLPMLFVKGAHQDQSGKKPETWHQPEGSGHAQVTAKPDVDPVKTTAAPAAVKTPAKPELARA